MEVQQQQNQLLIKLVVFRSQIEVLQEQSPTAYHIGGAQISEGGSLATVTPTVDKTGGVQITDGSPATVEPIAYQTVGVQISDGSPATVEHTAD